ncbi:MAG: GTPase [Planctomycetota bacterium]
MTAYRSTRCAVTLMTAPNPGAVAILQLHGDDTPRVLAEAFGMETNLVVGGVQLKRFADIDHGLLVRLDESVWQLMPHGGPRIVRRLLEQLEQAGATHEIPAEACELFPEAGSPIEADVLLAIANASSPAAIDLLADQPRQWRDWFASQVSPPLIDPNQADPRNHWLTPPTVVVVGRPNVGKSTLLNALVGRTAALVADLPGTTRDWVGSTVELVPSGSDPLTGAVAVRWLDTPGLRSSDDDVEQAAIAAARHATEQSDVLITLRSPEIDWPEPDALPREPDLKVMNKADTLAKSLGADLLAISAETRDGLDRLADAVLGVLGLRDPDAFERPWAFSKTLRQFDALGERERQTYLADGRLF